MSDSDNKLMPVPVKSTAPAPTPEDTPLPEGWLNRGVEFIYTPLPVVVDKVADRQEDKGQMRYSGEKKLLAEDVIKRDGVSMFDPNNPLNKCNEDRREGGGPRYSPLREGEKYEESPEADIRWEQMICQLSYNAVFLLNKFAPNVLVKSGCEWDGKKWIADTNQCVDIEILTARIWESDFEWDEYIKKNQLAEKYVVHNKKFVIISYEDALDEAKINPLSVHKINTIIGEDGYDKIYVCISKKGVLADSRLLRQHKRDHYGKNPVVFCKVGVPGHYTMAMIYLVDKRIEFFDPAGTYDDVEWLEEDQNKPYSTTLMSYKRTRPQKGEITKEFARCLPASYTYEIDDAVCRAFTTMPDFQGFNIVGIMRDTNLQIDKRDAYCQTWIWYYSYIKFIWKGGDTTKNCIDLLRGTLQGANKKKEESRKSLTIIQAFWSYLICLDRGDRNDKTQSETLSSSGKGKNYGGKKHKSHKKRKKTKRRKKKKQKSRRKKKTRKHRRKKNKIYRR